MYKYINAYYIQEIDWVDYKGGQKGGRGLLFFFVYFFRIFEIFFASAKHSILWFFGNKICYVNIFFCMNFLVDFVDFFWCGKYSRIF